MKKDHRNFECRHKSNETIGWSNSVRWGTGARAGVYITAEFISVLLTFGSETEEQELISQSAIARCSDVWFE